MFLQIGVRFPVPTWRLTISSNQVHLWYTKKLNTYIYKIIIINLLKCKKKEKKESRRRKRKRKRKEKEEEEEARRGQPVLSSALVHPK